jgi:GR25 family glycosyltransferase involved in LPS biosynthesis
MNQAYLISIEPEDSPRRRAFFSENRFDPTDFQVFGVVGATLSAAVYYQAGVLQAAHPLTPSEVGCKASHLMALQHFLASPAQYAWIFEDDARLKAGMMLEVSQDLTRFGQGVVLSVGGVDRIAVRNLKGTLLPHLQIAQQAVLKVHPFFMSGVHGAYAYMVDRTTAERLLAFHQTPHLTDEWALFCTRYPETVFLMSDVFAHPMPEDAHFSSYIYTERALKHQVALHKSTVWQILHTWVKAWWFKTRRSYIRKKLQSYPAGLKSLPSEQ